ncbi:ADP-ribosylation factor-like protein 5B isoform X1 [Varroa jacobsoni]|uniref:ADP-ribosylation factor-like protein 5B isoform X1 n=1 Tax=Varroa jacobsoni TaxID=62625 RepID=UPI000BF9629A|nr:ADP-ribosylation factor-like protein 5B isoform X1 [Varroa jacobsoni]
MGLVWSKLWSLFSKEEHKVVIVGLNNAGKTTILYQFLMGEVVHTSPTIGSNVEEVVWKNIHFIMWDLGGQESLRATWNTYYTNAEFLIVVVDSTDRERVPVTREELWRMLAHEDLAKAAVLVYANKQDVKGCLSPAEISQQLNLTAVKKHRWQIQPCCALTGEGYDNTTCPFSAVLCTMLIKKLIRPCRTE